MADLADQAQAVAHLPVGIEVQLLEAGLHLVEARFRAQVDVVEQPVDEVAASVDLAVAHDHLRLARAGATEGERLQEVFLAGRVEISEQAIYAQDQVVDRLELQRAGGAETVLVVGEHAVARNARVEGGGQARLRERRGRAEAAAAGAVVPAHGARAFLGELALGHREREQRAHAAIGPGVAEHQRAARIRFLGQLVVTDLSTAHDDHLAVVERSRRGEVDGRAERAFLDFGGCRLAHRDAIEQIGCEYVEVETAAAVVAARGVAAAGGGERFHAVDAHARELRAEAAHRDVAAFAGHARDRHAGNALQRLGEIEIGELADVLGHDHVGLADLHALELDRLLEAGAEAHDVDRLQHGLLALGGACGRGVVVGRLRLGRGQDGEGRAQGQRGGDRGHQAPRQDACRMHCSILPSWPCGRALVGFRWLTPVSFRNDGMTPVP